MSAPPDGSEKASKLRVRINQIDYVLAPPGDLDNSKLLRVPVIRIFGSSSTGKTACIHVHQVYPYLFVGYFGQLTPDHGKLEFLLILICNYVKF
jgi:DNA polymerase zeta